MIQERYQCRIVSTHSRPKAAGEAIKQDAIPARVSTHSRPKAAGFFTCCLMAGNSFQLTAARRRLAGTDNAAQSVGGFNSQPPEGGWRYCED